MQHLLSPLIIPVVVIAADNTDGRPYLPSLPSIVTYDFEVYHTIWLPPLYRLEEKPPQMFDSGAIALRHTSPTLLSHGNNPAWFAEC